MKDEDKKLTTNAGAPVPDNQNVMTAGPRGPMLLQDVWFLEKLAHMWGSICGQFTFHIKPLCSGYCSYYTLGAMMLLKSSGTEIQVLGNLCRPC